MPRFIDRYAYEGGIDDHTTSQGCYLGVVNGFTASDGVSLFRCSSSHKTAAKRQAEPGNPIIQIF